MRSCRNWETGLLEVQVTSRQCGFDSRRAYGGKMSRKFYRGIRCRTCLRLFMDWIDHRKHVRRKKH